MRIFPALIVLAAMGCATPADSYFVPVRTADQIVRDRGIVAVAFGKFGKFNSFVRKLTNDGKPLPPIDKKPREVAAETKSSLPTVGSEKPEPPKIPADSRPVVFVYLTDDWPEGQRGRCPGCIAWGAWHDQLTEKQKAELPLRFEVKPAPKVATDWPRPAFHWPGNEAGQWRKLTGWSGWPDFWKRYNTPSSDQPATAHLPTVGRCACPNCSCVNCECRPGEPCECPNCGVPDFFGVNKKRRRAAVESRPAPAPTVQAAISSISRDYVNLLLAYFGRGEVKLTPQASLLVPENLGLKISRKGDTVTAELSEPFPVIRYRTWGLRFDDTLRGATVNPQQAAIKLGTYGDVRFKVE